MNEDNKITFSEIYDQDGSAWIRMKIELTGNPAQYVDFDAVAQVEECADKILKYLAARRKSPLEGDQGSYAAEDEADYGCPDDLG